MNILFIYAHMDDETILSYGTMRRFIRDGHAVRLLTACRGRANAPQEKRLTAFGKIIGRLEINTVCGGFDDLSLTEASAKELIREQISEFKPELVVTHSVHDMHFEHRMLADCALLETRHTGAHGIRKLWQTASQVNSWTYGQFGNFNPNVFVDISEFMSEKLKAVSLYTGELPADNLDNRSADAVMMWNRLHGCTTHVEFAEPYQQIFEKI